MHDIVLNETPVRTARNFKINNVTINDFEIPNELPLFEGLKITNNSSKIIVEDSVEKLDIVYGNSKELTAQINNNANCYKKIIINSLTDKEIILDYMLDENNSNLASNLQIEANENTKATVVIKIKSNNDVIAYNNFSLNTNIKENANIKVIVLNMLNENSNNFLTIQNELDTNSLLKYYIIDFGGKNSITNYYSNIKGDFANNDIKTIYLGNNLQRFDINYIAHLRGKKSNVDIEVQGALKDTAKKNFKGTIDFKKGAIKATGNENEACLLLSDKARSISLPMLLCSEEDVTGNHSSSAGKVGTKELFYIMSRGFSLKEAQKLMVNAKFNKILESMKNEELKDEIEKIIEEKLS